MQKEFDFPILGDMLVKDLSKLARECALPVETIIPAHGTIGEALADLRKKKIHQKITYFYAVDPEGRLKGIVSTRQLLLANPDHLVSSVMQKSFVKLGADENLHRAMELFAESPLLALPVIEEGGEFLGMIDVQMVMDEAVDVADLKNRIDIFHMIGLSLEDGKRTPLLHGYRLRIPWLLCNVFSGLVCAVISRVFEVVLAKFLLLAFFIPLVLTLSESTSMQSMTQSLLFLRRPRFSWKVALSRSLREWQLAGLLAFSLALLVAALSLFWGDGLLPSICIGVGIFLSVLLSVFFGISIPIFLHRIKMDPKLASGPLVLMVADMLTTAVYLGLSAWCLL